MALLCKTGQHAILAGQSCMFCDPKVAGPPNADTAPKITDVCYPWWLDGYGQKHPYQSQNKWFNSEEDPLNVTSGVFRRDLQYRAFDLVKRYGVNSDGIRPNTAVELVFRFALEELSKAQQQNQYRLDEQRNQWRSRELLLLAEVRQLRENVKRQEQIKGVPDTQGRLFREGDI